MITLKNTKSIKVEDLPSYKQQLEATLLDHNGVPIAKGGVACPFPWRLHECLDAVEKEGLDHVISWKPHGRAFIVYQPAEFERLVLPRFFNQTRYSSFQRQLNIYGFFRFQNGMDRGSYYNMNFVRGQRSMVRNLRRTKIKGKAAHSQPEVEPDFYSPEWSQGEAVPTTKVAVADPVTEPMPATSAPAAAVNSVVAPAAPEENVVSDDSDSSLSGDDLLSLFLEERPVSSFVTAGGRPPKTMPSAGQAFPQQNQFQFAATTNNQHVFSSIPEDIFAPIPIAEMAPMQIVNASRNFSCL